MPETTDVTSENPAAETGAPAPRFSILAAAKVLLFVAGVVAAECLVAYLYLPSASDTAALAGATLGVEPPAPARNHHPPSEEEPAPADQVEVDLGPFSVTGFQPTSNTTVRIDFHLFGTVAAKEENEFLTRMQENRHRFREQVIVTVRSAEMPDLTDAGLGLIKRRILDKTNKTLGKPLLRAVIFSEFSFIEQ